MTLVRALLVVLLALAIAAACGADEEGEPPAAEPAPATVPQEEPEEPPEPEEPAGPVELELEGVLAGGLEVPWAVAVTPEGDLLVTERPGRLRLVRGGELVEAPVAELEVSARGEGGLLGLALHPDYPEEAFVYLYYTAPDGGNRISRFPVSAGGPAGLELGDEEVLLDRIPASAVHNGGRVAFGPDGMLYAGVGDAGQPELAADPQSVAGKILRLTPDGTVPDDNPQEGSPVWSSGHRNPQGLAWDEEDRLYASDHGPSGEFGGLCCHDELNLVEEGSFHGWPLRAGEDEAAPPGTVEAPSEPVGPLAESGPDETWAPGDVAAVDGGVLMANLAGNALLRFHLDGEGRSVVEQEVALEGHGRLRTVVPVDDGCFLVLTSNRDGRGSPQADDDRILRLCAAPSRTP